MGKGPLYLVIAFAALVVGALTEWRYVLAPVLGLAVFQWGMATMRSFRTGAYGQDLDEQQAPPEPVALGERTLYWCEPCGAEVLLVTRGADRPPRHCGQSMYERAELAPN